MNNQQTQGVSQERDPRDPRSKLTGPKSWFKDAGLGIFIHFGLYTLVGGNENDHVGKGPKAYRDELMGRFNPERFDGSEWVRQIKASGASYLVITSKHGEGFCLWPTDVHDYHVGNTPFKRDIIGELAEACHSQSFRFGIYHASDSWYYEENDELEQTPEAYSAYVGGMIDELTTRYGEVCELWLDGSTPLLPPEKLGPILERARGNQPAMVINDRGVKQDEYGLPFGDFVTPERFFPVAVDEGREFIEICDAMGMRGWGYHNEQHFHSGSSLVYRFCHARSLGANYLLNVEPSPEGVIREECVTRLEVLGRFNGAHPHAALRAGASTAVPTEPFEQNRYVLGRTTRAGNTLYVHLERPPRGDWVELRGVHGKVMRAYVEDASGGAGASLAALTTDEGIELRGLPATFSEPNPVVAVEFEREPSLPASFAPAPRPVRVEAELPTYVPSQAAALVASYGGVSWHLYETYANGAETVGRWVHNSSKIVWKLSVVNAGRYRLFAYLGTSELQAGAVARFEASGKHVDFTTVATGHYTEAHGHEIGTLALEAGEVELTLSSPKTEHFFPNVHHLILQPA
ncbi:MAG: alpha-L-fucosidase [Spirochaetota bacterium]